MGACRIRRELSRPYEPRRLAHSPDLSLAQAVELALRGEEAAVRLLVDRACTLSLRTAYAVVGTRDQALEVSQDVAVDVIRGLKGLREPAAFDAWVHRICSRHARRALRLRALRRRQEVPLALAPEMATNETHAELVATRSALAAALRDLTPRQQVAIVLRYVHDLSDAEIAAAIGCREGSVHALLSRARTTLRKSAHVANLRPVTQRSPT